MAYVPDVEMESIGPLQDRWNSYCLERGDFDDLGQDDIIQSMVTAAKTVPGMVLSVPRIRISAIGDLKKFN